MRDWRVRSGIGIGLAMAATVVAVGELPSQRAHGAILSDSQGAIQEIVIQYVSESAPVVERAYRQLLTQLPEEVVVYAVVPDEVAFLDLCDRIRPAPCRLRPIIAGHAMTTWSRDRWLALAPVNDGRTVTLLSPSEEEGQIVWPARAGDRRIGDDLARFLFGDVVSAHSSLAFDGGDFVADDETVFVTPRVARRNVGKTVADRDELRAQLERMLKRRVVLLDEAPDHHAGMFMMLTGDRTVVVGDPSLAHELAPRDSAVSYDFSAGTQALLDAVAEQCRNAGYRVVRMPVLPGLDGRTWETPINAILDERDGSRIVYMPAYRHAERLNQAATLTWQRLGFEVRPIDCTETYVHSGSLRCLVNVLRRV